MRISTSVIARVRGPLFAAALAGCASGTGAPLPIIETEPTTPLAPPELVTTDPVAYDAAAESARLAQLDDAHVADEQRRERRIEAATPIAVACGRG